MKITKQFEFPKALLPKYKKAKRIEIISIAYLISTALLMYITMSGSQTMKTAWVEDMLSLIPAISFLITTKIFNKAPNEQFPFGYHRVSSIAYLCSSLALFTVGGLLLIDAILALVRQEHPTIGTVVIFGQPIWMGYLMMLVLVYATIPAIFLGKVKMPLAEKLHEKNLYADAKMNKADWMTAVASIIGVAGIGLGWWWTDAIAAAIISADILHDGYVNLREATYDMLDQAPKTIDDQDIHPIVDQVKQVLEGQDWVKKAEVRLREDGHVFFGEGFIVPQHTDHLLSHINQGVEAVYQLDWKIHDFHITIVDQLPEQPKEKNKG